MAKDTTSDSDESLIESSKPNKYKCTHGTCTESFQREKNLHMHLYKHTGEV